MKLRIFVSNCMDIDEIRSAALSESADSNKKPGTRVLVVSESKAPLAGRIADACKAATSDTGLQATVIRTGSCGCSGLEPLLIIETPGKPAVVHKKVTPGTALDLIHNFNARDASSDGASIVLPFNLQNRIALRNCGWIDPSEINDYMVRGRGYAGLARALSMGMDRAGALIPASLRGRGGPGFSTAAQIQQCGASDGKKLVICNAVDPGTGTGTGAAKLLLDSDPHSVLEGMLISAYALGASQCILYVNAGHGFAEMLASALQQVRDYGLLDGRILDSRFNAEIEIEAVADSMVPVHRSRFFRRLAEPHVSSIYRGMRRFASGPVAIFNAETMAALSGLCLDGIEGSQGTKVVTLSGSVVYRHTAEVPFGNSLRNIINTIGGGIADGKQIRAVLLGGPAGTLIDSTGLDLQVGCAASEESHSNLGSGEIQVFDADLSATEIAAVVATRIHDQSCGRCVFCFEASRQISEILADIAGAKSEPQDIDLLSELSEAMRTGCGCTFGHAAAENLRSSLRLIENKKPLRG